MNIDRLKVNRIVEYIKQFPFEFDCFEVIEDLQEILRFYAIEDEFAQTERAEIAKELFNMAEEYEISEAAYREQNKVDPLLESLR